MKPPQIRARSTLWLSLAALAVVALVICAFPAQHKLPVFQGQTLYEWVARYRKAEMNWNQSGSPQRELEMETCQKAIRAIGTNALPFAMADVSANQGILKYGNVRWLAYNVRSFLKLPKQDRWDRGLCLLKVLGPIAEPCLPQLTANARHHYLFSEIALLSVGPAALPAFTNLLTTSTPLQTGTLVVALPGAIIARQMALDKGIAPEEAAVAVPSLIQVFRTSDNPIREYAASALGSVHQRPEICVPALAEGLSDTNARSRDACVVSLGEFGDAASMHAGRIAALFNSSSVRVRQNVCYALVNFHSAADVVVPVLVRALQDTNQGMRVTAAYGLGKFPSNPEAAIPALRLGLADSTADVRRASAKALGRFGPRAAAAVPALEQSCSDAEAGVRAESTNSLRLINLDGHGSAGASPYQTAR